ncbi:MAG: efflux transporter outer membrane subunit [Verrucomicrobiales bacterium]|jgi:multidrug efflux system outer membrane protein|nr:efflux transporter outer membrane subunit [Verrucomicrobiales bacterium]
MKNNIPFILGIAIIASSCAVGPDYHRPAAVAKLPDDWRWQSANPRDGQSPLHWWSVYQSPELSRLEELALGNNQDLLAAISRVDQARAIARIQGAEFFPQLGAKPQYKRQRFSKNNPQYQQLGPLAADSVLPATTDSFMVALDLGYEMDLWGRVRRAFESASAQAAASAAECNHITLTLTADVAARYFALRQYDIELQILRDTVDTRRRSLRLTQRRLQVGRSTALDVRQAETALVLAESDLAETEQNRAQTQNALAVLCGQTAPDFALAEDAALPEIPEVPARLPADLLERRHDIAAAERMMAAKNAEIGVAIAAYFPVLTLTGQAGYFSASASDLFNWPSSLWSIGPTVSLPLFTGGRTIAQVRESRAAYESAVASYRATVLNAFRDVEDALAARHFLARRAKAISCAVRSSSAALVLSEKRYLAGQVSYSEVTDAQRAELAIRRAQTAVQAQQLHATLRLIKALGGGWDKMDGRDG